MQRQETVAKVKILSVVGARPNFVKIAPIIHELDKRGMENVLVHTGQHYDEVMSEEFFRDLGLPEPDINLGVGSESHAVQTAKIMSAFESVLLEEMPDVMIVVGDVNSTLACSVVASKIDYRMANQIVGNNSMTRPLVCHVEAGLRSFDRSMPEEINRVVTDALSDILFVTEESGRINLVSEGKKESQIHFVGNVMIDSLLKHKRLAIENVTRFNSIKAKGYGLITLHRPSSVDRRETLAGILEALRTISENMPLFFPMHPRTRKQVERFGLGGYFKALEGFNDDDTMVGLYMMSPLIYLEFLNLMMDASVVFTDSGGIQEETTILGIPCVTIRENTERPVTVEQGTNSVVGLEPQSILDAGIQALRDTGQKGQTPELWDGKASGRIVDALMALQI